MDPAERVPVVVVAAATLAAATAVGLALSVALVLAPEGPALADLPRVAFNVLVVALPMALALGIPLALWRLRDQATGPWAWAFAGAASGTLGASIIMIGLAVATPLLQLIGHFIVAAALVYGFSVVGAVLTALLARRIALRLARK